MLVSMTAIGHADSNNFSIYIRSVNGKSLDVRFRWPRELITLEEEIIKYFKTKSFRGTIDVTYLEKPSSESGGMETFLKFCKQHGLAQPSYHDFYLYSQQGQRTNFDSEEVKATCLSAIENWLHSRSREGQMIFLKLHELTSSLRKDFESIKDCTEDMKLRLQEKLKDWLKSLEITEVEPDRITQEFGLLQTRHDVLEEISRIEIAFKLWDDELKKSEGPHGKKLEFILQEFHREFTTLSNKVFGTKYQKQLVDCKTLIDQLKEQVMNLE